jgi:hypothetical protein
MIVHSWICLSAALALEIRAGVVAPPVVFFVAGFLGVDFFAPDFFAAGFLVVVFFAPDFFLAGFPAPFLAAADFFAAEDLFAAEDFFVADRLFAAGFLAAGIGIVLSTRIARLTRRRAETM